MGTSFDNCHIRATDSAPILAVLRDARLSAPCFVMTDEINGWISVFADHHLNNRVARLLSEQLQTATLFLWEYDSDACGYTLYENGIKRDRFDSNPDLWVGETDENGETVQPKTPEQLAAVAGDPVALIPYCNTGITPEEVRDALKTTYADSGLLIAARDTRSLSQTYRSQREQIGQRIDSDRTIWKLCECLGIVPGTERYHSIAREGADYPVEYLPGTDENA